MSDDLKLVQSEERTIPTAATFLSADSLEAGEPVEVQSADGSKETRIPVRIKAYAGGVYSHWYWGRVGVDLESLKVPRKLILLRDHYRGNPVGASTKITKDGVLEADGFISRRTQSARELAGLLEDGVPFEASTGIDLRGARVVELQEGAAYTLNGSAVKGPLTVFENARLREISITAFGADGGTRTALSAAGEEETVNVYRHQPYQQEEHEMANSNENQNQSNAAENTQAPPVDESAIRSAAEKEATEKERKRVERIMSECGGDADLAAKLVSSGVDGEELYRELLAAERQKNEQERTSLKAGENVEVNSRETSGGESQPEKKTLQDLKSLDPEEDAEGFESAAREVWDQMAREDRADYGTFDAFKAFQSAHARGLVRLHARREQMQ